MDISAVAERHMVQTEQVTEEPVEVGEERLEHSLVKVCIAWLGLRRFQHLEVVVAR